jgi:hypothetical protein
MKHVVLTDPHLIKIVFSRALCPEYLDRPVDEMMHKLNEVFPLNPSLCERRELNVFRGIGDEKNFPKIYDRKWK